MLRATLRRNIYDYHFGQPSLKRALPNKVRVNYQLFPQPAPVLTPQQLAQEEAHKVAQALQRQLQCTTLSNGVRITTHHMQTPHSVIGFYVQAGAKYDPLATPGLSYVMRQAILTSNMQNSLFQIDRVMRAHGVSYSHHEIQKKYLSWKLQSRQDMWRSAFTTLAPCFVVPRFAQSDIERFRDTMDNVQQQLRFQAPRCYAVNELEQVAFYKEPLGSPRLVTSAICNDRCTSSALLAQYCKVFTPQRIVIAGVNVSHEELIALYEQLPYKHSAQAIHYLRASSEESNTNSNNNTVITSSRDAHITQTNKSSNNNNNNNNNNSYRINDSDEKLQFYEGKFNIEYEDRAGTMGTMPDMQSQVIVAVGVPIYGAQQSVQRYATALVLREVYDLALSKNLCHGAANSLYFNGSLTNHVSNTNNYNNIASLCCSGCDEEASSSGVNPFNHHGACSFYRPYASAGLIGFTLRTTPQDVGKELINITRSFPHSPISQEMLTHARRKACIRFVQSSSQMARDYCDFIALSQYSLDEMTNAIQNVSCENVEKGLQDMLEVKPALFATGSVFTLPIPTRLNKM